MCNTYKLRKLASKKGYKYTSDLLLPELIVLLNINLNKFEIIDKKGNIQQFKNSYALERHFNRSYGYIRKHIKQREIMDGYDKYQIRAL